MDWQTIARIVDDTIRALVGFFRYPRRERSLFGVSAILFFVGFMAPTCVPEDLESLLQQYKLLTILSALCYMGGIVFLAWGAWRTWPLVIPPPMPDVRDRPNVIKGPMAFTPDDGDTFRKLGRQQELQDLLGLVLDTQVALVTVMGESGAGKTSLLRAGLSHILRDRDIDYHYWAASTRNPAEGLLRSIGTVSDLKLLINPSPACCPRPTVVVLDQLEQLRGGTLAARNSIIQHLRRVVRDQAPPYRITWLVAFHRDYLADWQDCFLSAEHKRGYFPPDPVSLQCFSPERAHSIVSTLCKEAELRVEDKVVTNLVSAATVNGKVSPVDIGIGLMVLSEIATDGSVTDKDYRFVGGAEGLLAAYIQRKLDVLTESDRDKVLLAMLALRDPVSPNQRLDQGLSVEELVHMTKAGPRLAALLERLAQRDVRLLERLECDGPYRLPHQRLIPALQRLAGEKLATVERARLELEASYVAWHNNGRRSQYLLSRDVLRRVDKVKTEIFWGTELGPKHHFLRLSHRRHRTRVALAASMSFLAVFSLSYLVDWTFRSRSDSLVMSVLTAPPDALPYVIGNVRWPLRQYAVAMLDRRLTDTLDVNQRLHALCARVLFRAPSAAGDIVALIEDVRADECRNIVSALRRSDQAASSAIEQRFFEADARKDWSAKARLAIVAMHLGHVGLAADMLEFGDRPDPTERTVFIETFLQWHGELGALPGILRESNRSGLLSGISLAVGSVSADDLGPAVKRDWELLWGEWHQNHPDPGVHGASAWALRRWSLMLPVVTDIPTSRQWVHPRNGLVLVKVPFGTGTFLMSDREISVGLFLQFVNDREHSERRPKTWKASAARDHPAQDVSWRDAVMFCNWLSRQEGLTPAYSWSDTAKEWTPTNADGYRLPTEAEWEHACRAGTVTRYSCGDEATSLRRYGVFSALHTEPTGSLLCNPWGLFDMHGNVWEWCQDRYASNTSDHALRGGSFGDGVLRVTSDRRDPGAPDGRNAFRGFRIARSVP